MKVKAIKNITHINLRLNVQEARLLMGVLSESLNYGTIVGAKAEGSLYDFIEILAKEIIESLEEK